MNPDNDDRDTATNPGRLLPAYIRRAVCTTMANFARFNQPIRPVPTEKVVQWTTSLSHGFVCAGTHPLKLLAPPPPLRATTTAGRHFRREPTKTLRYLYKRCMKPSHTIPLWTYIRNKRESFRSNYPASKQHNHTSHQPHRITADPMEVMETEHLNAPTRQAIEESAHPTDKEAAAVCADWIEHLQENLDAFTKLTLHQQVNHSTRATLRNTAPTQATEHKARTPEQIAKARRANYARERDTFQTIATTVIFATVRHHPELLLGIETGRGTTEGNETIDLTAATDEDGAQKQTLA